MRERGKGNKHLWNGTIHSLWLFLLPFNSKPYTSPVLGRRFVVEISAETVIEDNFVFLNLRWQLGHWRRTSPRFKWRKLTDYSPQDSLLGQQRVPARATDAWREGRTAIEEQHSSHSRGPVAPVRKRAEWWGCHVLSPTVSPCLARRMKFNVTNFTKLIIIKNDSNKKVYRNNLNDDFITKCLKTPTKLIT